MTDKREIFRSNGRYEFCEIIYYPSEIDDEGWAVHPKYIIVEDDKGHQFICHVFSGIWAEMTNIDVISRIRMYERPNETR